ncbi:MAG: hypothetical protein IPP72_02950 [Chitinophagaceae bacterium]|nr:hypothetical protein [Chitinophagaceae bacterium]
MHTKQNKYLYGSFLFVLIAVFSIAVSAAKAAPPVLDGVLLDKQSLHFSGDHSNDHSSFFADYVRHFKSAFGKHEIVAREQTSYIHTENGGIITSDTWAKQKKINKNPILYLLRKQVNRPEWQN